MKESLTGSGASIGKSQELDRNSIPAIYDRLRSIKNTVERIHGQAALLSEELVNSSTGYNPNVTVPQPTSTPTQESAFAYMQNYLEQINDQLNGIQENIYRIQSVVYPSDELEKIRN